MRVALQSDSPAIGRTLTDLLALLRYEVLPSTSDGTPLLRYSQGTLILQAPDGTAQQLPAPLGLRHLATQLRNVQAQAKGAPLPLGQDWRIEPLARMLHHGSGQHIPLTEKECALLVALHAALPAAATREALLRDVWSYEQDTETHTLETHIYRLRQKLAELQPSPADILTTDGSYRLAI